MTIKFLCYPKCSTCQKARKFLDIHQIPYEFQDIISNNPDKESIRQWVKQSQLPINRFFNTSGLKYRELKLKDVLPTLDDEAKLDLLASSGYLLKRPLLISDTMVLVGFKESDYQKLL